MKILVITGSPHKKGTSALLADNFIAGALEAGHEVFRFDTIFQVTQPCLACYYCRKNNHKCIQEDDMELVWDKLIAADMVVFVTPVYYFGMSAQLKKVIDRFFAINDLLRSKPKKAVLLATCGDAEEWVMASICTGKMPDTFWPPAYMTGQPLKIRLTPNRHVSWVNIFSGNVLFVGTILSDFLLFFIALCAYFTHSDNLACLLRAADLNLNNLILNESVYGITSGR